MVKLNFTWGLVFGILILPILFIIFILYLYLKDKIEDFFYKRKHIQKTPVNANTKTEKTAATTITNNPATAAANEHQHTHEHEHTHENTQKNAQQENLIKIEDAEEEKRENFIKNGLHGVE